MLTIFALITFKDQRFKVVVFETKEYNDIVSCMSLLCVQLVGKHSISAKPWEEYQYYSFRYREHKTLRLKTNHLTISE